MLISSYTATLSAVNLETPVIRVMRRCFRLPFDWNRPVTDPVCFLRQMLVFGS